MGDNKVEDILLTEIRLNRKAITRLDEKFSSKINALDKQVFSNKVKLGLFITFITIVFNLIVIVLTEKIKTLFI